MRGWERDRWFDSPLNVPTSSLYCKALTIPRSCAQSAQSAPVFSMAVASAVGGVIIWQGAAVEFPRYRQPRVPCTHSDSALFWRKANGFRRFSRRNETEKAVSIRNTQWNNTLYIFCWNTRAVIKQGKLWRQPVFASNIVALSRRWVRRYIVARRG